MLSDHCSGRGTQSGQGVRCLDRSRCCVLSNSSAVKVFSAGLHNLKRPLPLLQALSLAAKPPALPPFPTRFSRCRVPRCAPEPAAALHSAQATGLDSHDPRNPGCSTPPPNCMLRNCDASRRAFTTATGAQVH